MKTIRHAATLYYYDGPQVFEARDAIGGHYIAVLVEPVGGLDRYFVANVQPARLSAFQEGLIDLRSLLLDREEAKWYLADSTGNLEKPLSLQAQAGPLSSFSQLPEPGFLLDGVPAPAKTRHTARAKLHMP